MFDVEYNGVSASDFTETVYDDGLILEGMGAIGHQRRWLWVEKRPDIPSPVPDVTQYKVPGRDGILTVNEGTVGTISITVQLCFKSDPDSWVDKVSQVQNWILGSGTKHLVFSDMPGRFYKVLYATVGAAERKTRRIGRIAATFVCDGYKYVDEGAVSYPITNSYAYSNPYLVCKPLYRIHATTGGSFKLEANGNFLYFSIGAYDLYVDTDRMEAYRIVSGAKRSQNTLIEGDYSKMWIKPGMNRLELNGSAGRSGMTGVGTLFVTPNWRTY